MRVTGAMAETLLMTLAAGFVAFMAYEIYQTITSVLVMGEWNY